MREDEILESYDVNDYEVLTDNGWVGIASINKTVEFDIYDLLTENDAQILCADKHIVFCKGNEEKYVVDLKPGIDEVITEQGLSKVKYVKKLNKKECMYDLVLDETSIDQSYMAGMPGKLKIKNHNSTIYTVFALHTAMFRKDTSILICANKQAAAVDFLKRIKMAYQMLPNFLKIGITTWAGTEIRFENGSSIKVSATSPDAARGTSADICVSKNTYVPIWHKGRIFQAAIKHLVELAEYSNLQIIKNIDEVDTQLNLFDIPNIIKQQISLSNFKQCQYHVLYDIDVVPKCVICGKDLSNKFRGGVYPHVCGKKCEKKFNEKYKDIPVYDSYKNIPILFVLTNEGFKEFDGINITTTDKLIRVKTNKFELYTTPSHKLFNNNIDYKKTEDYIPGETVNTIIGTDVITEIEWYDANEVVYDLINVQDTNAFYTNGIYSHNCILDEAAFVPDNIMDEFVESIFPTISSRPNGKIIAVSTPNGMGNWYAKTWHQAIYQIENKQGDQNSDDVIHWNPIRFDWWEHPERDEKWKAKQIAMFQGDERKFSQEFGNCIFDCSINLRNTITGEVKTVKIEELVEELSPCNYNNSIYEVLTPIGFKKFDRVSINNKHCICLTFDNGNELKCSLDHPIFINDTDTLFATYCVPSTTIKTIDGYTTVSEIIDLGMHECYDLVNVADVASYYTNDVLSHNCFESSSATLIDGTILNELKRLLTVNPIKPIAKEKINDFTVNIYKNSEPGHVYGLSVDPGDGTGNDTSVILVADLTDCSNLEVVASFGSNTITPIELAYIISKIGLYYNNAVVIGERNGIGSGMFDSLHDVFEYENLVYFGNMQRPGIHSSNKTKIMACLWAKLYMEMFNKDVFYYDANGQLQTKKLNYVVSDNHVLFELEFFERKAGSTTVTYQAAKNQHDDYAMAFVWLLFLMHPEISDNYLNVRSTLKTQYGVEIPHICSLTTDQMNTDNDAYSTRMNKQMDDYKQLVESRMNDINNGVIDNTNKISDDEFFKMNQMLYGTNGTDADYISGLRPRNGF